MQIQKLILNLQEFWSKNGCLMGLPYDIEKGAGTMNPLTFFGALGPDSWRVAYAEPSRRPADGRYGDNPFRVYKHLQFQVLLKPSPANVQDLYLESLSTLGIDLKDHDLRFEEDNWESPTLGAWGVGWQVVLDGMEISQFTYFQQMGGIDCKPVSAEITYGVERLCMFLGGNSNIFETTYGSMGDSKESIPVAYGKLRHREEIELSHYSFNLADISFHRNAFDFHEKEGQFLLKEHGHFISAYEQMLKMSHAFNVLDARGAISVSERPGLIKRVRDLASGCAQFYLLHHFPPAAP